MPLFICSSCKCIENTACGDYWNRRTKPLCSECAETRGNKWHGHFPKRTATLEEIKEMGVHHFRWEPPIPEVIKGVLVCDKTQMIEYLYIFASTVESYFQQDPPFRKQYFEEMQLHGKDAREIAAALEKLHKQEGENGK